MGVAKTMFLGEDLKYSHTASWNRRQTDGWKSESSVIFEAAVGACTQTGKLKSWVDDNGIWRRCHDAAQAWSPIGLIASAHAACLFIGILCAGVCAVNRF